MGLKIEQNTTELQEILSTVNALPDVGTANFKTATITIVFTADGSPITVVYTSGNGKVVEQEFDSGGSITVAQNTPFCIAGNMAEVSGGIIQIEHTLPAGNNLYYATADGTITSVF